MGYAKTAAEVYVVAWDDARILKIGETHRQRWRSFALRGARVLALMPSGQATGCDMESAFQAAADTFASPAFTSAAAAEPYLGSRGGGYLECYRIPRGMTADQMLKQCSSIMLARDAQALLGPMPRTYVRTDLRRSTQAEMDPATNASPAIDPNSPQRSSPDTAPGVATHEWFAGLTVDHLYADCPARARAEAQLRADGWWTLGSATGGVGVDPHDTDICRRCLARYERRRSA